MHVSSLPGLFLCPSSQSPVEHPYDPQSDAAELGHAVHEGLSGVVVGRDPDLNAIALRYGVKPQDVKPLVAFGRMAWDEVKAEFPNARVEERLIGEGLRGRADVFQVGDGTMCVLDWKTSRARSEVRPQLRGYGVCAVEQYGMPESGVVKLFTVWLRLFEIDQLSMKADDVATFYEDVAMARRNIGKRYSPGEACTFCRRQLVCRARHEYINSAVVALAPVHEGVALPSEVLPLLHGQAKALGRALEQYQSALRMLVRTAGPQEDGRGNVIEMGQQKRTTVDAEKAWPILTADGFTDDDLAKCITMSTTSVLEVVGARAPKGFKGKAKVEMRERLQRAGAMKENVYDTLKVRKRSRT